MSHAVSGTATAAIFAQQTSEVFLTLLKIDHASLATAIRVVNDSVNFTSQGHQFLAFPFTIEKPSDTESKMPQAQLTIDNVDRQIVEAVRTLTGTASVEVSIVLASSPDVIERGPWQLQMRNVQYNATTITADLLSDDIYNENYPGKRYTPSNFPGLFP